MKYLIITLTCLICLQLFSFGNNHVEAPCSPSTTINKSMMKLKITIGAKSFLATLYANESANAFKKKMPLRVNMKELNSNEKYVDLPYHLPANASNPGTIHSGDLMLYGSNTLVLFYKTFSTTYSYSQLARIDNPSELAEALGAGTAIVQFELE